MQQIKQNQTNDIGPEVRGRGWLVEMLNQGKIHPFLKVGCLFSWNVKSLENKEGNPQVFISFNIVAIAKDDSSMGDVLLSTC